MECLNADQEMFSYQNLFRKERFCDKLAHLWQQILKFYLMKWKFVTFFPQNTTRNEILDTLPCKVMFSKETFAK
jgi:hypothetical protein